MIAKIASTASATAVSCSAKISDVPEAYGCWVTRWGCMLNGVSGLVRGNESGGLQGRASYLLEPRSSMTSCGRAIRRGLRRLAGP